MKTGINMGNDMKRISNRVSGLCLACVVFLVSCMKETDTFRPQAGISGDNISFNAVNVDNAETRTSRQADGAVWWDPADNIHIFYGSVSSKFTTQIKSPSATATFSGSFEGLVYDGSGEFWALYPYSETDSFDGNSLTFSLSSKQKAVAGTFDRDVFPAIARSSDLKLKFRNVCGGIKFCVNSEGISRVTFKGNRSEALAGTVKVVLDNEGIPSVSEVLQPKTELSLAAPDGKTFEVGKWYHLVALPGTLQTGYTMTLIYNDNHREIVKSEKAVEIKRSTFGTLTNVNEKTTETQTPAGGTQSGLYLGIIGFNKALYYYPIRKLNMDTLEGFNSFIDGLGQEHMTLLYYSVKEAIRTLQVANYPHNISSASIVTFTDGEDDGSVYYEKFPGDDEDYLSEVNSLLYEEEVAGLPLSAWTIGLMSSDASYNPEQFLKHLQKLSRPASNGVRVTNMSAVNSAFERIAQELNQSFSIYNVSISMVGKANDTRVRFTLDNVSTADNSSKYIEGTFDMYNVCLYDVSYHGFSCSSGTRVQGTDVGGMITFHFTDIRLDDNSEIRKGWIKQWRWDKESNSWHPYSEFDPNENSTVDIVKESAVVLLNLDCTTSLGNDFATLKTHAKSFIYKLCQAAYDASQVSSVTINKTTLSLYEGDVSTLTATVRPTTATEKSVAWSSSDESVVTVTQAGRVTAVSPGTATVKVTTKDGGYSATCQVTVQSAMVDLGLSVKWATRNVGASSPEGYGNYYAWGETSPKSNYDWSTYRWGNSETNLTKYNTDSSYGRVDHKTVLDLPDDAAHVVLGGKWRMPTDAEWLELLDNCTWTWTTQNGIKGYRVTSNKSGYTNKSIFLPAAGYSYKKTIFGPGSFGHYLSSSLVKINSPYDCWEVSFGPGDVSQVGHFRDEGYSVRAVYGDFIFVESISLNKSSLSIKEGETRQLSATVKPSTATEKTVSWSSSNTNVATVDYSDGWVTGVSAGTATITAWSSDGKIQANCEVTVGIKVNKYLTFTSEGATTVSLTNFGGNAPALFYSTNKIDWMLWDYSELSFSRNHPLYICGNNPRGFSSSYQDYSQFVTSGDKFSVSGDSMSLIDCVYDSKTVPSSSCFYRLFRDCSDLISPPDLSANDLAEGCYSSMFSGCTSLIKAPELPATTMEKDCYSSMFSGCTSLINAPALPATTLAESCYKYMFHSCAGLISMPDLPATTLAKDCYAFMFVNCTSLTEVTSLPATTLANRCYIYMFSGCSSLETAPMLPATTLADSCYDSMFNKCYSLRTAPALPATTLASNCYSWMFAHCTSLIKAPDLPATTLADRCYYNMFTLCKSMTSAPALLPATRLENYCYYSMFSACSSLKNAPMLPATTLADHCYNSMFAQCASLTEAPNLPATTLAYDCYAYMFVLCTSLTSAPRLPATTLAEQCYERMFASCTGLINAPDLPAKTMKNRCYKEMFDQCSRLNYVKCLATDITADSCVSDWLAGVSQSGTFVKASAMNDWTRGGSGIPNGWTIQQ